MENICIFFFSSTTVFPFLPPPHILQWLSDLIGHFGEILYQNRMAAAENVFHIYP